MDLLFAIYIILIINTQLKIHEMWEKLASNAHLKEISPKNLKIPIKNFDC